MTTVVSVAQGGTGSNSAALARTALGVPPSAAYDQANTARDQANTARTQANSAYAQANSAYSDANTRLSASGGTLAGDLIITGNLTVSGNSTTLNAEILTIEDADVVLLSNVASTPALNAGIIVNRGTSTNTFLRWDEVTDKWGWSDDGSTTYKFNSALDAYAQANSAYGAANNRVLKAGDTMTGQLNISAGGLLVTGNVGIGTTSPAAKLDIYHGSDLGSGANGIRVQRPGAYGNYGYLEYLFGSQDTVLGSSYAGGAHGRIFFRTHDSAAGTSRDAMIINDSGNVGIGTTSPGSKLHVVTDSADSTGFNFETTGSGGKTFFAVHKLGFIRIRSSDTNGAAMHMFDNAGSKRAELSIGSDNKLNWYSDALTSNWLTFDGGNGRVGIGTTSPTSKLHIVDGGILVTDENAGQPMLQMRNYSTAATGAFVGTYGYEFRHATSTTTHGMLINNNEANDSRRVLDISDSNGIFASFVNGKVGISTTSPAYKVQINRTEPDALGIFRALDVGSVGAAGTYIDLGALSGSTATAGARIIGVLNNPATSGYITFNTLNSSTMSERMIITAAGNVGVNQTSPTYNVHIGKSASGDNHDYGLLVERHGTGASPGSWSSTKAAIAVSDTANAGPASADTTGTFYLAFGRMAVSSANAKNATLTHIGYDAGADSPWRIDGKGNHWVGWNRSVPHTNDGSFCLLVRKGISVGSNHQTTTPPDNGAIIEGNVGIGTTSPATLLSLGSPSHTSPSSTDRILNWYATSGGTELHNSTHRITIGVNSADTSQPQVVGMSLFNSNSTNNNWSPVLIFGGMSTSGNYMNGAAGIAAQLPTNSDDSNFRGGDLHFFTQGTTLSGRGLTSKVVIKAGGTVGIGITNPNSFYKLDMNGPVQANGTMVLSGDGGAGYVGSRVVLRTHNNYRGAGMYLVGETSAVSNNTFYIGTPYTDHGYGLLFRYTANNYQTDYQSAAYTAAGTTLMWLAPSGAVNIPGSLSKGSGSFKIDHPLPEKANSHFLVHSFIEGPQADLIYRGRANLINGIATVNIDTAAGMTEGTFVLLCRDVQCFTSNETDWDNVRGSVSNNILTIECQNASSNATIAWMVIGERQDKHMYDTEWTDEIGKVIVEPEKPAIITPEESNVS